MGTYLSTPVTDKATEEGACLDCPYTPLAWGVVDMQGWRKSMEDAHVAQTTLQIPQQHVHNQFRGASYDSLGEIDSDEDEEDDDDDEGEKEGNNDDEKNDDDDDDKPAVNQTAAPGSTLYPSKKKKTATSSQQQQGTPSSLASASSSLERQQRQQQQSGQASLSSSSSQQHQPLPHGTAKVFGVFDGHGGPEVARFCQLYFCSVLQRQVTWQNPSSISASYNANLDPAESDMGLALRSTFHGLDTMIDDAQRRQEIIQLRAVKPMPGERRDVVVVASSSSAAAPASTTTDPPTPKAAASEPPPPQQQKQQEEVAAREDISTTAGSKLAIPIGDADNAAGPTTATTTPMTTAAEAAAPAAPTSPVSAAAMTHANAAAAAAAAVPLEESASSASKDGSEEEDDGAAAAASTTVPVVVENLPADDKDEGAAAANPVEDDDDDDDDGDADSHEAAGREEAAKHDQDLMNDDDDDDNDLEELDHEVAASTAQQQEQQQQPQEHEEPPPTTAGKVSVMFQRLLNMSTSAVTGAATGGGAAPASNQSGAMVLHVATHPDGTSDSSTSTGTLAAGSNPELAGGATPQQQPGSPSAPGTGAPGTTTTTTPGTSTTLPTMVQNGRMICNLPDHPIHAGATAIVVVIVGKLCTVANAGDSRAVLCRGGTAFPLSADHKPLQDRELTRIKKAGGFVNQFGRVNGNLNLSRSIGDLKYKQVAGIPPAAQMITAEPDIVQLTLDEETDEFVILGCDGIWDCLSNEKAVQFVRTRIHDMTPVQIGTAMLDEIISEDPRSTQGIGGDNMTVMIVDLKPHTRSYYQQQRQQGQGGEATEPQRPASPETSTSSSEGGEGGTSTNNRPPAAVLRYGAGGDGIV